MKLTRRQVLGTVTAAMLTVVASGVAQAAEYVRLSAIEDLAQTLAEQAAQHAKKQGWEVSPEKIEKAKQRIIRDIRKSFEEQQVAVTTC